MIRSIEREEVIPSERSHDRSSSVGDGLSRSGGEKRPARIDAERSKLDFGMNQRERIVVRNREYRIRTSEEKALTEMGTFRVLREADLIRGVYGERAELAKADLRSLHKQRLIESFSIYDTREGTIRVHTLTKDGHALIKSSDGLQLYSYGIVKPAEVFHDSLLYRAYLRESEKIRGQGGAIRRVVLDSELKRAYSSRVNKPGGSFRLKQAESALELHLPVIEGHVMFPDFRIEYEDERGELSRSDVEVATGNYREQHIAAKATADFKVYAQSHAAGRGLKVYSGGPLRGNVFPRENRMVLPL